MESKNMASLTLKNIKKVYPFNGDDAKKAKKRKKGDEPEKKKANLQITDEGVVAVQEFNLEIADKEFIVLVGPSGCGKSTTLRMIAGLEDITGGELYIGNRLVNDVPPKDRDIAMVFQNYALYPHMTVYDNMAFSLKLKKLPKDEINRRVESMIKLLGLEEFRKCYPHQLSVSTAQRIIIGRAFALQPDLLLMDEPYGQMDIKLRFYLEDEVIRLWKETGTTVVFITHNIEEAVYLAERVLILTNKPAKIKEEVMVDLPRPRKVSDPAFIKIRNHITDQIKWW